MTTKANKIIGFSILLLWIILYTGGTIISTAPYRDSLNNFLLHDFFYIMKSWIIVFLFYTMSNVAILCCLGSMIGGICRGTEVKLLNLAILGLFVYLALSSGVLLLGTQPFDNLSQAQYIRLAGTYSLFSFMIGYDPKMINQLISKIEQTTSKTNQ